MGVPGCRPRGLQAVWLSAALTPAWTSYLNSLGLCFLTHENYTSCSDTQTAKHALRSALGNKPPKRRSAINIRSINSNGDDCNNLASLEVSCGAFSSLAFILAT